MALIVGMRYLVGSHYITHCVVFSDVHHIMHGEVRRGQHSKIPTAVALGQLFLSVCCGHPWMTHHKGMGVVAFFPFAFDFSVRLCADHFVSLLVTVKFMDGREKSNKLDFVRRLRSVSDVDLIVIHSDALHKIKLWFL